MAKIGVFFYSGYGHTKKQAEAVIEGAGRVDGAEVEVFEIDQNGDLPESAWDKFKALDAMIYGSPTYMGGPAWQFKKFADGSSKPWFSQDWKDKIAGGFTNSATVNGDKLSTLHYLFTLSQQHGQIWIGTGQMPANAKEHGPEDANWTGGFSGAMAISPFDASPEEAPRKGDLESARLYGERIAGFALKMRG